MEISEGMSMNKALELVHKNFKESLAVKQALLEGTTLEVLVSVADEMTQCLRKGGKIMFCGNGGSAADAQHLAAELLVRLRSDVDRRGLPALALAMDSSTATACGNDYSFEALYARMVDTLGGPNDMLVGITTSGNSSNVIQAFEAAKRKGICCVGFLGEGGGKAKEVCDLSFEVPSRNTARVQESHITAGHCVIELVEDQLLECGEI
jgi:D-sedoheptulose 7-phosphate isomerase